MHRLAAIGFILVLLGIGFIIASSFSTEGRSKFAVVGLFGPIPFGFGNDRSLFMITLAFAVAILVLFTILRSVN